MLPILIAAVAVIGLVAVLSVVAGGGRKASAQGGGNGDAGQKKAKKSKGRAAIISDATKRLSRNSHDPAGLIPLADLYFSEQLWDKAYPLYETMAGIAEAHQEIDAYTAMVRAGICAVNMNRLEDAIKFLNMASTMKPSEYDVNYYYGLACLRSNMLDKAVPCLKKALIIKPDSTEVFSPLGLALFKFKRYKDSLPYLKRALDLAPENKELLFAMGSSMQESGYGEKALKIFMHLRTDPEFGARSALSAGMIHERANMPDKAILDYDIGMKHQNVMQETMLELKYRLAGCYLKMKNLGRGLPILKEISQVNPRYKDVPALIARYQELNQNSNLQTYLIAATSDFVSLCRKLVAIYFPHSVTKIMNITPGTAATEIITEIETTKWEDVAIFCFYRTTGSTGELYIRDFYEKIRSNKAGRGVCLTAGVFSAEAKKFVEGRPIDLVEKDQLVKLLKKVDTF